MNQVTRLRAELDYDRKLPDYEVEFFYDGYEYDYKIHAETGEILSVNKEYDD